MSIKENEMFFARSSMWGDKTKQTYAEHIHGVMQKALKNVEGFKGYIADEENIDLYKKIIVLSAMYHDLGKLSMENQKVLRGDIQADKLPIDHRDAGINHLFVQDSVNIEAALVYAHHYPGLPDLDKEKAKNDPFRFENAIDDTKKNAANYVELHKQLTGCQLEKNGSNRNLKAMEYRMLLSCLVDADYTDASGNNDSVPEPEWKKRSKKLDQYINALPKENGDKKRNRLRAKFYKEAKGASVENAIEYCDSPVGTGKTTAIMAHMLKVAYEHNLRHIVVVLPYTNIISQTVQVLRKALVLDGEVPEEIVAEHHHLVDFKNPTYRYLATTWKAPIIVTTAVQFFETLASNQPARLRKLCQLPGSAIIFDEYHAMLPPKLMLTAWRWINALTTNWGCRVCMSSATSTKVWDLDAFKRDTLHDVAALLSEETSKQLYEAENSRVKLNLDYFNKVFTLNTFIDLIKTYEGSKIIVFNTIQKAACFANIMRKRGYDVLHLSSALTPEDREKVIDEINRRLDPKNNYPDDWILSATSCVECGMNFSFRYGFKEIRSMQSAIQLSGRVSRENEYKDAMLILFKIRDDNFDENDSFRNEIETFESIIKNRTINVIDTTDLVTTSLEELYKLEDITKDEIRMDDKAKSFKTVAEKFCVIEDGSITVVVNQKLAKKVRFKRKYSDVEMQRGSVNISKSRLENLNLSVTSHEVQILNAELYDTFLGYMKSLV